MRTARTFGALLIALLVVCTPAAAQVADPDPARFAKDIALFEEWDRKNAPPKDAVLFVGSSTIRLWPTAERFPDWPVINRGFGGSHISDVNHYLDRVVLKYDARVILFYAGDNDIGNGKSPAQVLEDYQAFVSRVRAARPDAHIIFLPVKPSLARWTLWETMRTLNEMVRKYSATQPRLHYIDVAPPMLGSDGRPRPELFIEDGLHMSAAGYDLWTGLVQKAVAPLLAR